jgi:hypothetical protein
MLVGLAKHFCWGWGVVNEVVIDVSFT